MAEKKGLAVESIRLAHLGMTQPIALARMAEETE